jgi:hypothetical protein
MSGSFCRPAKSAELAAHLLYTRHTIIGLKARLIASGRIGSYMTHRPHRLLAIALFASLTLAATAHVAEAQGPPPCPSDPSQWNDWGGTLGVTTSATFEFAGERAMKPCETVVVGMAVSYRVATPQERIGCGSGSLPADVSMKLTLKNASGDFLATEDFLCRNGSCFIEVPKLDAMGYPAKPSGYPLPGTRGAQGLAKFVEVTAGTFNWCAIPPVFYTMIVKKQPRPLYNRGGDSFENAPLIDVGEMQYGTVHPLESPGQPSVGGQFYRIRLKQDQLIYVSGEATGHNKWGSNFTIHLHDANQQELIRLTNVLAGTAVQFPAAAAAPVTYVNMGPDADFFLRVRASAYPTWAFKFQVESPRLTIEPNPVTRGEQATFRVLGAHRATFEGWRYASLQDGEVLRQTNTGAVTWPGVIVAGGRGSVTVKMAGRTIPISSDEVQVLPRSGWAFEAEQATKKDWPFTTPDGHVLNPVNPPTGVYPVAGAMGLDLAWGGLPAEATAPIADQGPNHGFKFIRTQLSDIGVKGPPSQPITVPTAFYWVLVPDLENPTREFFQMQCGDYVPATQMGRFISGDNLQAQTIRHESGASASHHRHYVDAQNDPLNNLGIFAEAAVKGPNVSDQQFKDDVAAGLQTRVTRIYAATQVEPYGVNMSDTGQFLGEINFAPNYVACPPAPLWSLR